jgi:NitT/TauT family transport system permease protein
MRILNRIRENKVFNVLIWLILLVIIWEIAAFHVANVNRIPENVLPHLTQILQATFSKTLVSGSQTATGLVLSGAKKTLFRALLGFVLGVVIGILLALLMNLFKPFKKIVSPYLMIVQMIPILGMAPIVLAITGNINVSRVIISALLTFYPVATNVFAGFKSVPSEKLDLMYICNANKFQVYTKTLIPTAVPYLFTGLKISVPLAVTASILVDTLQGDGGLGALLSQASKHAMSIYVFWEIIFFAAIVGILSFTVIGILEKIIMPVHKLAKE